MLGGVNDTSSASSFRRWGLFMYFRSGFSFLNCLGWLVLRRVGSVLQTSSLRRHRLTIDCISLSFLSGTNRCMMGANNTKFEALKI